MIGYLKRYWHFNIVALVAYIGFVYNSYIGNYEGAWLLFSYTLISLCFGLLLVDENHKGWKEGFTSMGKIWEDDRERRAENGNKVRKEKG